MDTCITYHMLTKPASLSLVKTGHPPNTCKPLFLNAPEYYSFCGWYGPALIKAAGNVAAREQHNVLVISYQNGKGVLFRELSIMNAMNAELGKPKSETTSEACLGGTQRNSIERERSAEQPAVTSSLTCSFSRGWWCPGPCPLHQAALNYTVFNSVASCPTRATYSGQ